MQSAKDQFTNMSTDREWELELELAKPQKRGLDLHTLPLNLHICDMQDLSACLPHSLSLFLCFFLSSSLAVVSVAGTAIWAKPFGPT